MSSIQQAAAKFLASGVEFNQAKQRLMSRVVLTVEANSKRVTPYRYGHLRRSINSRVEASGERGIVGSNVVYAWFVHDGTSRMAARPFLLQGLAVSRDSIDAYLREFGEEILAEIPKG
jgi:hypothetical protein